ncbi:MAG: type III pantothenate kinase [Bacteroidales bacterium]
MRLIIDYGNTRIKTALFDSDKMVDYRVSSNLSIKGLLDFLGEGENSKSVTRPVRHVIVSSVVNYPTEIREFLESRDSFVEFNSNTKLPFTNKYKTPETLGNDRISAVAGALHVFPGNDLLVIDAGTCITYDFVNAKREYFGGGISPGIDVRFKALNTFTGKLPLITRTNNPPLIGRSTKESIWSGVLNGVISEVDGIIDRYIEKYPNIKIIFTGGDAIYFDKKLKNNIFANSNLVMIGLNDILNINGGIN